MWLERVAFVLGVRLSWTLCLAICSGFFPVAVNFLRRVPVIGQILNTPGISTVVDKLAGDSNRTTV